MIRRFLIPFILLASAVAQVIPGSGGAGTPTSAIVGQIQTATGGTINSGTLTFTLSQPAIAVGNAAVVSQVTACYTAKNGNIVGLPDPVGPPVLTVNTATGTAPAGNYYVVTFYTNSAGLVSAVSPEAVVNLGSQGTVIVNPPSLQPSGSSGFGVAIGQTPGSETIQGTVTGFTQFQQKTPISTGSIPSGTNNSVCNVYFSDMLIPTGTYYTVNLTNRNASQVAGFPQTWCTYGGAGGTINVSQGAPTGSCNTNGVFYPTPLFSSPPSGAFSQSVNSGLNLGSFGLTLGPITASGPVSTFGGVNAFSNPGVFTDTQLNQYVTSNIGNINFTTEFQLLEGTHGVTDGFSGGVNCVPGATVLQCNGIAGYAINNTSSSIGGAMGGYFQARTTVANSHNWGSNSVVADTAGCCVGGHVTMQGAEFTIASRNAQSTYDAVYGGVAVFNPSFAINNTAIGFDVENQSNGAFPVAIGFRTNHGTAVSAFTAGAACNIGGGNTCASQPLTLVYMNGGTPQSISMLADSSGNAVVQPTAGMAAVVPYLKTNGATPTCAFTSGGGTVPSCSLDTGSSNAAGIIIATTGSGSPAGTGTITLTFSGTFGTNKPVCMYQASDGGAGTWSDIPAFKDVTPSTATDLFRWTNQPKATGANTIAVPVALSTATAYWINYQCWAK